MDWNFRNFDESRRWSKGEVMRTRMRMGLRIIGRMEEDIVL